MRIIAGRLGGRRFASPHGRRTRPMSDKVRGALFNALGDLEGLSVLDAFAGSGALSFEAVSRGAEKAVAIDIDKQAQRAIAESIQELGLESRVKLIKASAAAWLSTSDERFDIVICDPPYDNLQLSLLSKLAGRVQSGGLLVVSLPPDATMAVADNFQQLSAKNYGDAQLIFYRNAG